LELLLATALLGLILAMAYAPLVQSLQIRSDQETAASVQARMRRVLEVFTQDLRSAVFGAITNTPYPSSVTSVSFALIEGGAGYPVLPHDQGGSQSFRTASETKILQMVADQSQVDIQRGDNVLMVNASGQAVLLPVTNVNPVGGEPNRWHIVHAGCGNTIDYTPNTLLFRVRTLGFKYRADTRTLLVNDGLEMPLAFEISRFRIDYVYRTGSGNEVINPPGYAASGTPAQVFNYEGRLYTLRRLQLVFASEELSRGKKVERTYTGQVELSNNPTYQVKEVVPCR